MSISKLLLKERFTLTLTYSHYHKETFDFAYGKLDVDKRWDFNTFPSLVSSVSYAFVRNVLTNGNQLITWGELWSLFLYKLPLFVVT